MGQTLGPELGDHRGMRTSPLLKRHLGWGVGGWETSQQNVRLTEGVLWTLTVLGKQNYSLDKGPEAGFYKDFRSWAASGNQGWEAHCSGRGVALGRPAV